MTFHDAAHNPLVRDEIHFSLFPDLSWYLRPYVSGERARSRPGGAVLVYRSDRGPNAPLVRFYGTDEELAEAESVFRSVRMRGQGR